ncbi:hypothetical protein [Paenarthrobacter sp. NPDC058040]|uniref:hypothetical protein n=1 Tax=unclassified Paenarthrobacter TaxID=2634190 RepID=UPI0036DDDFA5
MINQDSVRREATDVLAEGDLSLTDLWIEFFARGGMAGVEEFEAFIQGMMPVEGTDLQILDLTLVELQSP